MVRVWFSHRASARLRASKKNCSLLSAMDAGVAPSFDGLDELFGGDGLGVAEAIGQLVAGFAEGLKAFLQLTDAGVLGGHQVSLVHGVEGRAHRVEGVEGFVAHRRRTLRKAVWLPRIVLTCSGGRSAKAWPSLSQPLPMQ